MLNNHHYVLADVCDGAQLCNAAGTAVGKCVKPVTTGLPCSSSTPGKNPTSRAHALGFEEEVEQRVCLLSTKPLGALESLGLQMGQQTKQCLLWS